MQDETVEKHKRDTGDCPDVSAIQNKIDYQERRHNQLEQKIDLKLDELIKFTHEVVKLQERNNRNSDDIANLRTTIADNSRTNSDAMIRLHTRLDVDMQKAREEKKEADRLFNMHKVEEDEELKVIENKISNTRIELDKFKNIAIGISLCMGIIIGMGQYIVNNTLGDIRDSIGAIKDLTVKSDVKFASEANSINKKLDAQVQVNQEVDEQLRKITEKIRSQK